LIPKAAAFSFAIVGSGFLAFIVSRKKIKALRQTQWDKLNG
jgi:hypothetical protein